MKRMKLFLHLAHLNHMFLKSVTKTGRDPPSECKKTNIFCEGFPYILRFWRCLQEIQVFSCHTTNEVWMHLLARDEGVLGPGDSWCRGWPLSSVSHRCIPCCSGHWPASGRSLNLKCWQLSFVLVLIWAEQASSVARVGRSPGAARVKEVQGWVWVWDWAGAANWATCAMCQVWWLEKTFLPLTIIIKPLNAVTNQYSEFGNWKKIQAPPDNMT